VLQFGYGYFLSSHQLSCARNMLKYDIEASSVVSVGCANLHHFLILTQVDQQST